jgi:CheY-like chemotaxis protein
MMMTLAENETALSPVLVVDDDPLFRETLCGNLEDNGYRTIGLDGGRAILDYFE